MKTTKDGVKLPRLQIQDLTKAGIEVRSNRLHNFAITNDEAKLVTLDAESWLTALNLPMLCTNCPWGPIEHPRIIVKVTDHHLIQYIGMEYDVCGLLFEPVDEYAWIKKLLVQSGIDPKTNKKNRWQNLEMDIP